MCTETPAMAATTESAPRTLTPLPQDFTLKKHMDTGDSCEQSSPAARHSPFEMMDNNKDLYHLREEEEDDTLDIGDNKDERELSSGRPASRNSLNASPHIGLKSGVSIETSKLLRGILQGKDKQFMGGAIVDDNDEETDNITSKMHREDVMMHNGGYDDDQDSLRSPTPSGGMSLPDSDVNSQVGVDDMGDSMGESPNKNGDDTNASGDSAQAKRARVENIITSMRVSPTKIDCQAEQRRGKRKNFIPMQHDSGNGTGNSNAPSPKYRKVEKSVLKNQLHVMQSQLSQLQQKYLDLFENESPDDSDLELCGNFGAKGLVNGFHDDKQKSDSPNIASLTEGLLDSHTQFFKQANKMFEAELNERMTPISRDTPGDLDNLAKILKKEIANSVSVLVDSIVAKFVQKQQKLPKVVDKPSGKENNNNSTEPHPVPMREKNLPSMIAPQEQKMEPIVPKPTRTKVTDKLLPPTGLNLSSLEQHQRVMARNFPEMMRAHPALFPPPPYFPPQLPPAMQPLFAPKEPEQTEALALVVGTPKKKRTKVTDTRLSPRAARALLQEGPGSLPGLGMENNSGDPHPIHQRVDRQPLHPHPLHSLIQQQQQHQQQHQSGGPLRPDEHHSFHGALIPTSLPTSVAIPNPSLQHSEVLAMYSHAADHPHSSFPRDSRSPLIITPEGRPISHSPLVGDNGSPNAASTPNECRTMPFMKLESMGYGPDQSYFDHNTTFGDNGFAQTTTLTPMHLRKAKLMFFFVRYPSSAILKVMFPDINFNKNNTAQLVKWFSNFREFYYIQMEKYARQAIAEGVKNNEDLFVTTDSEIYRVLNLHYNRNNQIEVPDNFRGVIQSTLREFYKALVLGKDSEQSWKKAIYKVIARMDDQIPEFFKSINWMEQLNDL